MRSREQQFVLDFCLEQAEQVPVARRISLYRGLAEICGDMQEQRQFKKLAAALEAAEHQHREFRFKISQGGQS